MLIMKIPLYLCSQWFSSIRRSKKYLTGFSGKMSTEVKGYVLALLPPSEQSEIESGAKKVVMVVQAIFEGK